MPKKSNVWKYFTRLTDNNGKCVDKATCNNCAENKEFNTKGGTTNMWRHFLKHFTHIVPDDQLGHENGIVQCNICQSKLEGGITSRVEHVVACVEQGGAVVGASRPPPVQTRAPPGVDEPADLGVHPLPSAPSRPSASSPDGEEPDMEKAKYHLAKMIALRGYDPSIIDDDCFSSFVKSLNPKFRLPSRDDIKEVCKTIFHAEMDDSLFQGYVTGCGRTSLGVGKAKVFESEVIYMAYHFIDEEWDLHKMIRDATINPDCFEIRVDIGLNMISSAQEFYEYDDSPFTVAWGATDDHSKLKGFLNQYSPRANTPKRKVLCTTFVDYILHSVAGHLYQNIDPKFRGDIFKSVSSFDQNYQLEALSLIGLDLWEYKEVWYSWYCFLLIFRQKFAPTNLKFSELLCKIFGEIYRAIRKFSASNGPTANLCLVELFNVRKFLLYERTTLVIGGDYTNLYEGHTGFVGNKHVPAIMTELTEILEKAIQEWYLVWSIPLVLDPRYKLRFVTTIFREAFCQEIADRYIFQISENLKVLYSEYVNNTIYENQRCRRRALEELDNYLTFDVVSTTEGFDILKWWKDPGSNYYVTLAGMAMDALAIPTCNQLSSEQTTQLKSILRGYYCDDE